MNLNLTWSRRWRLHETASPRRRRRGRQRVYASRERAAAVSRRCRSHTGASEQVEALLQSDAFNDPAQLKQAMRQGVDAMKAVGSEFGSQLGAQMKLAQQNPEAFKAQMEAMMSQLAGGPEQGRALMEAAKGLWDGSADPAQLEALSKLPGMEALADPEAMKRQMAELQKMMGAGQVPAMGGEL